MRVNVRRRLYTSLKRVLHIRRRGPNSFRRSQRRGLRRKVALASQPYGSSYIFPPTNTSTLARSSVFQLASPIRGLVSPR
jgi:hypothetical protein